MDCFKKKDIWMRGFGLWLAEEGEVLADGLGAGMVWAETFTI